MECHDRSACTEADELLRPVRRERELRNNAIVLGAIAAAIYAAARAAGLADLGRRVDLVKRSVRRGEGDPELAEALRRDAEGEWE